MGCPDSGPAEEAIGRRRSAVSRGPRPRSTSRPRSSSGGDEMPAGIVRPPLEDVEAIRMFLEKEGIAPGAHLLDVPCGIGRRAVGLAEAGYQVTAVDPNEMGIAAATERVPHAVVKRSRRAAASRRPLPGLPAGARGPAV